MNQTPETELVQYEAAKRALVAAHRLDEVAEIRNKSIAMQAYGRLAKDEELSRLATEIRLRAERRLGELMEEQRRTVGVNEGGRPRTGFRPNPVSIPTLAEVGIDKNLAHRARKAAAMPEEKYETKIARQVALAEKAASIVGRPANPRSEFSGEWEWCTPAEYIERARAVLGRIDLDPATSSEAQKTVQAEKFYTIETDGLKHPWSRNVWLNPPYAAAQISGFVAKLVEEIRTKRVRSAILLTNNSADTSWFQEAVGACTLVCLTRGRIRFLRSGDEMSSPTQGQAFFYFGANAALFKHVFSEVGSILAPEGTP